MPQWTRDDPVNMVRVDVSPDGGIVVGGTPSAGSFGVACLKCATDSTPLWANRDADGPAKAFLSHGQMRLARDENVDAARGQAQAKRVAVNGSQAADRSSRPRVCPGEAGQHRFGAMHGSYAFHCHSRLDCIDSLLKTMDPPHPVIQPRRR